jgi:hypothetical protein
MITDFGWSPVIAKILVTPHVAQRIRLQRNPITMLAGHLAMTS